MPADVLSDVLRSLRATGTVYFCEQLQPPWTKRYPGEGVASFHQIRRGGCRLESDDIVEHLGPGDLVFLAPGRAHTLISEAPLTQDQPAPPGTLLMCGYCSFDQSLGTPMAELFPEVAVIRDEQLQDQGWLRAILDQLSAEFLSVRPGTDIVVNKLTEVLLVELVRMSFGQRRDVTLIKALNDRYIGEALRQLHQNPAESWSLELLASKVGLSRAGFAKRFKTMTNQSMFDYLTQLRLQQACQLLQDTTLPLIEVASRVGYESDLAFTRTFKKRLGLTPTAFRKQSATPEA